MSQRAEQRAQTRERIVSSAAECFSRSGFRGTGTREIARHAGTTQGLITYHFGTKEELWRAAADRIFGLLRETLRERSEAVRAGDPRTRAREGVRAYVCFAARHPELFRLLVEEGKCDDARMQWLADTHIKALYEEIPLFGLGEDADESLRPHLFYVLAGAASLLFAVAPECRRVTGLDPTTDDAIERHADLVARMVVP